MNVDLSAVIRRQIPVLLDKMIEAPVFITGNYIFRLIYILMNHS
jgi:hypothetical protein